MSEERKDIQQPTEQSSQTSSYRSIFKATSLFGGVQMFTILIQIIKSKIVAVLLGPYGVGIQGLYMSAIDLIKQATSLGISQSAVRDVAEACGEENQIRVTRIVNVLRRIVWITGLLGLLSVVVFSPLLSKTSFGDYKHIWPFVILSVVLLFDQLSAGQKVVLQGTRRLKKLAKATTIGAAFGLVVSIPLYYFFGVDGIVPMIILTSAVSLFISWFFSKEIHIEKIQIPPREVFAEGKTMLSMGISMCLSGVMSTAAAYLTVVLIREWGGTEEVGLFQSGVVIVGSYVGLIFNAIITDYYPRLASVNKDNEKCREIVSQQGEISVFILAPMLTLCIIAMPLVILIIYSEQFLPANNYIKWACLGMMFRLASWLIAHIFLAKAESKLFIINEFVANFNYLWMSVVGYKLGGLTGVGIAYVALYFTYFIQVFLIAKQKYNFSFSLSFVKTFIVQLVLVSLCLACVLLFSGGIQYIVSSFFALLSIIISIRGLNKTLDLRELIASKLKK